jgi:hypothetical protein
MLDRIAKVDPALRPYARVTPERALAQAEVSEAEIAAVTVAGQCTAFRSPSTTFATLPEW